MEGLPVQGRNSLGNVNYRPENLRPRSRQAGRTIVRTVIPKGSKISSPGLRGTPPAKPSSLTGLMIDARGMGARAALALAL